MTDRDPRDLTPRDLVRLMLETSKELDASLVELQQCAKDAAKKETDFKRAWAIAYLASSGTVGERDAHCTKTTADERYASHLAEGLERSALEAVRSVRQKLSALQSISTAVKTEYETGLRYGPSEGAA